MMSFKRLGAIGIALGTLALLAIPTVARADEPPRKTTISFVSSAVTKTGFGGDWVIALHIKAKYAAIGEEDGTVDITVAGMPGIYAKSLPIEGNGDLYLSPPDSKPALGAGKHLLTAFFRPTAGSGLSASHTSKAATVTVAPLTAVASVAVSGATAKVPSATLSLTGTWTSTTKSAPPGSWTVTVTGPASSVVYSSSIPQPSTNADPIVVPISAKLKHGTNYTVAAVFTPDAAVLPGLTLTQAKATHFRTADLQLAEALSQPVVLSPIASGTALLVLVGFIIAVAVLGARLARRRRSVVAVPIEG